jgi:nitrite reductase/ring-hydroxylating ferredoxin subunit
MSRPVSVKPHFVRVSSLKQVQSTGCVPVQIEGHTLALFAQEGRVHAIDNRCPHMGFPLHRGTLQDGILTCHWHHARFDLATGGTFDLWADDVRAYPVEIRNDEVWVDLALHEDPLARHRKRLHDGLKRNIPLVIGKAALGLINGGEESVESFRIGLDFGVRYRRSGWGQGLTILTCMMNLLPHLDSKDRARAAYQGLSAVAGDSAGEAPRFPVQPLPGSPPHLATLKRWFRRFVEVRDAEGAERCLVSALRAGCNLAQAADMLFAAATDHRYIQIGHVLDFTNKALEALGWAGADRAEPVLTSLVSGYAGAERMEETNAWRHPVNLIGILQRAFDVLPDAVERGQRHGSPWTRHDELIPILTGDDPNAIAESLLTALREGAKPVEVAGTVAYASALRVARFHTSNEFSDWDTALHSFTFANAVHQALLRLPSPELLRGVFDAAMSVYLDRFLNVPAARLPDPNGKVENADESLQELPQLLDRQQQVNEAGRVVARYLHAGADPGPLLALLGRMLLREDRDFHTIQMMEGAVRQFESLRGTPAGVHVLAAAARYLAAHAPTVRAEGQTFQIAYRLHRGETVFEE